MKYGYCLNHPKTYAVNSRKLCSVCTKERHKQVAESKGFTVKEKSNEFNIERRRTTELRSIQNTNAYDGGKQREVPKAKPFSFKKAKIKYRSEKGKQIVQAELLLFQKIFNERPPECEWCQYPITVFSPINYHHLKTKGSHPELRLVESNIVKICANCHLKEHSFQPRKC